MDVLPHHVSRLVYCKSRCLCLLVPTKLCGWKTTVVFLEPIRWTGDSRILHINFRKIIPLYVLLNYFVKFFKTAEVLGADGVGLIQINNDNTFYQNLGRLLYF